MLSIIFICPILPIFAFIDLNALKAIRDFIPIKTSNIPYERSAKIKSLFFEMSVRKNQSKIECQPIRKKYFEIMIDL